METSLCMLLILFQTAQNIGFSQVNAFCLSPVFFFYALIRNLFLKRAKHCVFTGKCNLCASRPISFYFLIRNLFQTAKNIVFSQVDVHVSQHCVFTGRCACVSRPIFSSSLIHILSQHAQNILFSQSMCMSLSSHFFVFPNSRLINSFDVALPMDCVICDVLLLLKRKIFPFFN